MMDIDKEVVVLRNELIRLRRDFHQHPELGLQEFRTAQIVEDYLRELGLEVRRCTQTGVIGVLKGNLPGKTMLMRCDIDALPIQEKTGLPFASKVPGIMHACGHDGHTAIHMITAKILAAHRDKLQGTVVFLFQTNEEDAGAELMIQAGALDNPKPDAVFGFHLLSNIPTGKIGVAAGPLWASCHYFKLIIFGKSGHGAMPHTAINPIDTAAHVLSAINSLKFDALKPTIVSVGQINGGEKANIIPEQVVLKGSIRCLHNEAENVCNRLKELCLKVCSAYRCTCEMEFKCGNTLLSNDEKLTTLVIDTAGRLIGKENILTQGISSMLGDDFAEFSRRLPGVYYLIGTADKEAKSTYAHHNSHFTIDEKSLPIAVSIQAAIAYAYLS